MALFRLFPRHKAIQQKTHEENASYKSAAFNADQIRIVLFRECDFRGRKLLFDSDATEKVPVDKTSEDKKFVEVNNGCGYFISKQNSDYHQLSEMVFGSIAMSFQGSYFKIHRLSDPCRLMFTYVFQCPHSRRHKLSTSSQPSRLSTRSSFEHSSRLDDSGASSMFSTSERLSDRSTASDTILVCRRLQTSPLDVPRIPSSLSRNSLVVDSGCTDQSFSSVSTGPVAFSTWQSIFSQTDLARRSFSSCNAFKRILRSSTRSLKQSSMSLPNSTEEVLRKNHRISKLGLSILIEVPSELKDFLTLFLMEHIALIDALIWRTRQSIELAYHRSSTFISSMMDIAQSTSYGLISLLNAPRILINLWHSLSDCDNHISINSLLSNVDSSHSNSSSIWRKNNFNGGNLHINMFNGNSGSKSEWNELFNFSFNFNKTDNGKRSGINSDCFIGEKFLREFCELVEFYDVKDTNFFISTLLTAVLTHHLGWVSTVLPANKDAALFNQPFNALWGQLIDLYGAVGYPVKTAQTVITGTNTNHIITKILNSLTYFIRFNSVERKDVERISVEQENQYAEAIFSNNNCIPKEYYKRYEDHVKEMLSDNVSGPCSSTNTSSTCKIIKIDKQLKSDEASEETNTGSLKPCKRLTKVKTHIDLSDLIVRDESECISELKKSSQKRLRTFSVVQDDSSLNADDLATTNSSCSLKLEKKTEEKQGSLDLNQNSIAESTCDKSNVIFVLGENEKLVGLKKEETQSEAKTQQHVSSGARRKTSTVKRPTCLNFTKSNQESLKRVESKTSSSCLITSSSFESLCLEKNDSKHQTCPLIEPKIFARAQSEPPENKLANPKHQISQVKFNLQQYPQVVKNYMKSKNIELEGLPLGEKVYNKFATVQHNISLDFSGYESDSEQVEGLQTPSNASEMEFASDMCIEVVKEDLRDDVGKTMKMINIPMPKTVIKDNFEASVPYPSTVMKGLVENYIPDMVLQGTTCPKAEWESKLKRNLAGHTQHSLLDQPVEESLAVLANTDTWEVQLISSHTYIIDKGLNGVRIGMSQLVSSMLESLLQMWKSRIPAQHCLLHIEQKLQEICLRSKALAQLLLGSEFCNIELLTSALRVEMNDVPLLMAIASTHTPEVTQKYGLSFQ